MAHNAPAAPSTSEGVSKGNSRLSIFALNENNTASKQWKPPALRTPVLVIAILICWSLIAVLQIFLTKSLRDGGIIFAPRVSDLPLSQSFVYLYFPTIVAVLFSIYWAWIDLETKRMEPFYQLSKENGALGRDSLLLQYPFDFLPLVPIKALRDRHWPVFWASFAVLLVTWGIVPTQAGIFSTKIITRTTTLPFARSTSFVPASKQTSTLPLTYAQSTYAIATLNETLTQYMARNYTLAPFQPASKGLNDMPSYGNWTAPTTMYSVQLYCQVASQGSSLYGGFYANSTNGCAFSMALTGNLTKGANNANDPEVLENKEYTAMYVGYWNTLGFADYSLDYACPAESNHTFYAAFQRNKARVEDPPNNVTAIFCWPTYYQQRVNATVSAVGLNVLDVNPVGEKQPLQDGLFNTTWFESLMSSGSLSSEVRGDVLPSKATPKYLETIAGTNLSLSTGPQGGGIVQPMVGMAVAVGNRPLADYLDWQVLSKSYADAYRLMFARAMREILDENYATVENVTGQVQATTEAVVLEPLFVYIVEGLLGVVSLAIMALIYLSLTRTKNLRSSPSTIASIMGLVADNQPLLSDFQDLDCCTTDGMKAVLSHKRYKLVDDGSRTGIIELDQAPDSDNESQVPTILSQRRDTLSDIAKPVRPVEFSLWVAFPVVSLFIGLAVLLVTVFVKARLQGLPLPSSSSIVENIIENYIPTVIATLIEPIWVLINRLLCMLQPIEELRDCNARAKKSIDCDYSSLPPQLVLFKALRSRHFVLAAVCTMALFANLLAVAFAGLFQQETIDMRYATELYLPYQLKFVSINGDVGPIAGSDFGSTESSGAYQGGTGEDQFLIAESNYTQGTPLPAWTDDKMFYMPFFTEGTNATNGSNVEAQTQAFGAELDCIELDVGTNFEAALFVEDGGALPSLRPSINITISKDSKNVRCTNHAFLELRQGPIRETATCVTGPSAAELTISLEPRTNATQEEREACMESFVLGWIRDPQRSCPGDKDMKFDKQNSIWIQCRPRWITGNSTILVNDDGRLQRKAENSVLDDKTKENISHVFSNDPVNLAGQSNRYMFKGDSPGWHNDSFADDFMNYFIIRSGNNSLESNRLVNPKQGVPTFGEIIDPLNKAYSNLFAIWLGTNKNKLFVAYDKEKSPVEKSWRIESERRLFVSTPMFAISEGILCIYAIVAIIVYMRRPGQYLPRLPTSIASIIALFAASTAIQDMRDTSYLDKKGRARHLEDLDSRYGYGSFIGWGDGRVHIGVEKSPFVRVRSKTTWLEKQVSSFRKGSAGGV
ncbi:hypothetical protein P153DRAFT_425843 [Dothidotthia symphoricarpi CBS 119687]|uniref:Uncharacterized protein n=1 Tax=Dothidotthia symphoricarpi CBS 119687 TaxID=1392245 RepID=A0A6A6A3G2_9PLEO|nr:uncharacterized protein P153DRAFT_425843 [Dothidotthia symphoricarpi CBS 119687]KAF2125447.1 hypothetical protein P153DRAFT_425843 [Dothidotthia symphoricarpi CBS 119687]